MPVNLVYKALPTVALRGIVLFPGMNFHFDVGRKKSIAAVKAAMHGNQKIFLVTQKDITEEDPTADSLYKVGIVAEVKQVIKSTDNNFMRVVVEGVSRASVIEFLQEKPYFITDVRERKSLKIKDEFADEAKAAIRKIKDVFDIYAHISQRDVEEVAAKVFFSEDADELADLVAGSTISDYTDRQELLEEINPLLRLQKLYLLLKEEVEILKHENDLDSKVEVAMEKNQRDYFLREKMRIISEELGEGEDTLSETEKFRKRINALNCSDEIKSKLISECNKLSKMQSGSADASVARNYIETALSLPFGIYTEDNYDLGRAEKILDDDHYGLEKIKKRFIEMLAVKSRTNDVRGQIICLVGPPGVGKTSIVRSVAKSMGRKYVRLSLGGVSDEAEIRGHRKTYVGAMPGRIVNAVISAKTFNPIILLDEIDKLGRDYKGDPASAMLEVLDPEQNFTFRDNYMEFHVDLSKVLFITTANDPSTIPGPLYDRMEIIELTSYTPEEKFMIAKKHLVKKQTAMHGLNGRTIRFNDEAIKYLIDFYTREAGVRRLEQTIGAVCRKSVVMLDNSEIRRVNITKALIKEMLGPEKFKKEEILPEDEIGVVNGLAWTSVGGEMLQVEAVTMKGDGKLELTGSLGDVMKESARAAYSYIRSRADKYGIPEEMFTGKNIHIHVPQGAVPKDGPSAGVTIATALLSVLTGRKVRQSVAMTGEISLTGRVLPIGGLKEKSMAAYKAGVKKVIIPQDNEPDLYDIDEVVKNSIEFVPVSRLDEVFRLAVCSSAESAKSNVKFTPHDIIIKDRREKDEIR